MKGMRILVDTNILLDYLLDRQPFAESAAQVLALCEEKKVHGCVAAHSIVNIFYILRGRYPAPQRKEILRTLCQVLIVVGIDPYKIFAALENNRFEDIEDCLQAECAKEYHANYIITRDGGFAASEIPALEPDAFLALIEQGE